MLNRVKYWVGFLRFVFKKALSDYALHVHDSTKQEVGQYNLMGNNRLFNTTIGKYSYVSFNSILYNTEVGNYCSIGPNVVCGFGNHPTNEISTSPLVFEHPSFNPATAAERLALYHRKVLIGNDVWIGANVVIKNGVVIGDGAVVGAGAVVVKDVSERAIVVGVPAKVLAYRTLSGPKVDAASWGLSPEDLIEHFNKS